MTLGTLVSQIRSQFKLISSDNSITNRAIADELRSSALLLIKRETDKRKLFSSDNIFTWINCLEMEPVPLSSCCSYASPCTIAKSKLRLPKIVENIYGYLIQGVFSVDDTVKFDYADPSRYTNLLSLYPKQKNNLKYFWIRDGYLYITDENIELVKISALFEDYILPKELFACENTEPECTPNPMDMEFKCPAYLQANVLSLVRETMLKTYKQSVQDNTENDVDEAK